MLQIITIICSECLFLYIDVSENRVMLIGTQTFTYIEDSEQLAKTNQSSLFAQSAVLGNLISNKAGPAEFCQRAAKIGNKGGWME